MPQPDIAIFKALAVEPRARIVSILCKRCLCSGALARILGITPGAVSQHLSVLKDCGLVTGERRGYFMHYRITEDAHERAGKALDVLFDPRAGLPEKGVRCTKAFSCPGHKENAEKSSSYSHRKERFHV